MIVFIDWILKNEDLLVPIAVLLAIIAFIAWIIVLIRVYNFAKDNKGKKIKDTKW